MHLGILVTRPECLVYSAMPVCKTGRSLCGIATVQVNKYFELKKLVGRPKLELLTSNGVHICHAV